MESYCFLYVLNLLKIQYAQKVEILVNHLKFSNMTRQMEKP